MSAKYIAYLTANDDGAYTKDFINFMNMCIYHPGVEHINLFVAISAVRPFDDKDSQTITRLLSIFDGCSWITVKGVVLKGNGGRDFSSAYVCLKSIASYASNDDVVMVKNRSGYGPLAAGWFDEYEKCLLSDSRIGLVGSTINFSGHPKVQSAGITTHVQTYVYVSFWKYFAQVVDVFPAIKCTNRLNLIDEGEIGLSRMFLDKGLALACLAWPGELFTRERPTSSLLPQADIKRKVKNVPIRYKFKSYGRWRFLCVTWWGYWLKSRSNVPSNKDLPIVYSSRFGDVGPAVTTIFPSAGY